MSDLNSISRVADWVRDNLELVDHNADSTYPIAEFVRLGDNEVVIHVSNGRSFCIAVSEVSIDDGPESVPCPDCGNPTARNGFGYLCGTCGGVFTDPHGDDNALEIPEDFEASTGDVLEFIDEVPFAHAGDWTLAAILERAS